MSKNKKITNKRDKKTAIDFNANNYDVEELAAILNFETLPLNEGIIKTRIQILSAKFSKNSKATKFFEVAEKRLIDYFKGFNKQTWQEAYEHDDSAASKELTQQFQYELKKEAAANKSLILNQSKNIIGRARLPPNQNLQTKGTIQGTKNPVARDIIKRIVNFDSHYRQILKPDSVSCPGISYPNNTQRRLYTPTNYTVNLTHPLINVVDLTLESVEIPNSWYVFSGDYGTNRIKFLADASGALEWGYDAFTLQIPDGNYTATQLQDALNRKAGTGTKVLDDDGKEVLPPPAIGFFKIDFSYNSINNKFTIHNNNSFDISAQFYTAGLSVDACPAQLLGFGKVGDGGKVDYNLGWLLGFRVTEKWIPAPPGTARFPSPVEGLAPFDNYGSKYFIISLDDFNNNKPNKDLISLVTSQASGFKLPAYFNPQTMDKNYQPGKYYNDEVPKEPGWKCVDPNEDQLDQGSVWNNPARGCFEGALNTDISSNLTKKQQYTVNQIQAANKAPAVDRYSSPNATDLLARIPINQPRNNGQIILYKNDNPTFTKRLYFGPVKLSKFKVRLLNDKGFEVNLNEKDWSFSIIVSQLYQY